MRCAIGIQQYLELTCHRLIQARRQSNSVSNDVGAAIFDTDFGMFRQSLDLGFRHHLRRRGVGEQIPKSVLA
jgi:hypothetical protein